MINSLFLCLVSQDRNQNVLHVSVYQLNMMAVRHIFCKITEIDRNVKWTLLGPLNVFVVAADRLRLLL